MKRKAWIAAAIAALVCTVYILSPLPVIAAAIFAQAKWPERVRGVLLNADSRNIDYGKY